MHYFLARQPSWIDAYRASLTSAHPPLLILIVHYWRMLGDSELVLRLPSVILGAALCWTAYKWFAQITDFTRALVLLILLSFSPTLVALGSELRQYSFLLFFCGLALYQLEQALRRQSSRSMLVFSFALYLALLTHYSSFIFAFLMGIYVLLRCLRSRPQPAVLATWAGGQALGIGICILLYRTHIAKLKASGINAIADTWLRKSFFHEGQQTILSFLGRATFLVFDYLFAQPVVAGILLLLFVLGLVALFRNEPQYPALLDRTAFGWYLAGGLILTSILGIAGLYPYGGSRHDAFLILFLAPGISLGLNWAVRGPWRTPVIAAVLMLFAWIFLLPPGARMKFRDQKLSWMRQAVSYVHQTVALKSVFLLDNQSTLPFRYYFCRDERVQFDDEISSPSQTPQLVQFGCGGYRVAAGHPSSEASPELWTFSPQELSAALQQAVEAYRLGAGDRPWFFQTGWGIETEPALRAQLTRLGCVAPQSFGRNILLCRLAALAQ